MKKETYCLATGEVTQQRLNLLNEIYNPFIEYFMRQQHILQPGMRVLELACGFGIMSGWLAEQVGETGEVIGVDISEDQLAIARKNAAKKNLNNIRFVPMSVYDLEQLPGEFDLIYGRYILCHLVDPKTVIAKVKQKLSKQGVFVIEDMILKEIRCIPEVDFFTNFLNKLVELYQKQNKHPNIGEVLPHMLVQAGFSQVQAQLFQPMLTKPEQKRFFSSSYREMKASFLEVGIFTGDEFDQEANRIEKLEQDPNYILSPAPLVQCAARV